MSPPEVWYLRDASWHAKPGKSTKVHLPRGDGTALCSPRIVLQDMKDDQGWQDPPVALRCLRCAAAMGERPDRGHHGV